jgi:hypothetical protein
VSATPATATILIVISTVFFATKLMQQLFKSYSLIGNIATKELVKHSTDTPRDLRIGQQKKTIHEKKQIADALG